MEPGLCIESNTLNYIGAVWIEKNLISVALKTWNRPGLYGAP